MNYNLPQYPQYQVPQQMNPYQQFQQTQQMPQQYQQSGNPQLDRLSELQMQAQMRDQMALNAQMQQMQNQSQGPKIIPVGNIEEAKAYLSPTTGEKVYFLNNSNNEIYSKQLDFSTGKSNFSTYRLIPETSDTTGQSQQAVPVVSQETSKKEEIDMSKYVSKDDYETLKTDYSSLKKEFDKFRKEFTEMWGEPTTKEDKK